MFFSIQLSVSFLYSVFNEHSRCAYAHRSRLSTLGGSPTRAEVLMRGLPLVGSSGLEPPTSRLSGGCSNQLSYKPILLQLSVRLQSGPLGGDDGIRTHDPLLAGQVLSQLSYTPSFRGFLVSSGTLADSRRCWR